MGNLLGKDKSKAPIVKDKHVLPKDKAILDLKRQRDRLKQYQVKIEVVLGKEVEVAKHHLRNGDQGRALLALKKKKYQERLLLQTDQQLLTLEQLTGQIEYALVEQDVMKGLEQGNEILKQIHQEMSLDSVQKLMDDTADGIAYQAEIDELISGSMSAEDEDEIMAQLDVLEQEELAAKLPAVPETPAAKIPEADTEFPEVPATELPDGDEPVAVEEGKPTAQRKAKKAAAGKGRTLEEPLAA
ncbi:Vacuolar protein sorting-associated protein 20 [Thoreauomyces humboldtii]|nr:Vacuolar protein sorting-associated protein 20 [Thoreauomyces humboldtii]